jgi:hypothetical protein
MRATRAAVSQANRSKMFCCWNGCAAIGSGAGYGSHNSGESLSRDGVARTTW